MDDLFRDYSPMAVFGTCFFLKSATSVLSWKWKNTKNNYNEIITLLGALKSLPFFILDIEVNDILNYRTNYLLR